MHEQKLLSIVETARLLGIGRSSVYKIVKEGRLPVRKLGTRTLIQREDIDRFIDTLPSGATQP